MEVMEKGEKVAALAVGIHLVLFGIKYLFSSLSGSIALKAEAFHSLSDVIASSTVFAGLILIVSRQKGKARLVWLIATLFLLPPAVYVTGLCLFLDIWGVGHLIAVPGLPAGVTIALAEVFAVSFEALLLYLLARKTVELTFRQAAVLSIMANMSSFLIGLLVTGWL